MKSLSLVKSHSSITRINPLITWSAQMIHFKFWILFSCLTALKSFERKLKKKIVLKKKQWLETTSVFALTSSYGPAETVTKLRLAVIGNCNYVPEACAPAENNPPKNHREILLLIANKGEFLNFKLNNHTDENKIMKMLSSLPSSKCTFLLSLVVCVKIRFYKICK